jgi:His-Xaa-Ser system protein HxsD
LLDKKIASIEAVQRAAYELSDKYNFDIKQKKQISISIQNKDNKRIPKGLKKLFKNRVLDHQVRISTENEFKNIREIIFAQAFEPIDNLDDFLKNK